MHPYAIGICIFRIRALLLLFDGFFFSVVCSAKMHERLMNLALPEQFSLSVMRANGRARQQITNVHSSLIRLCDPIQNIGVASAYLSLSNKNDAIICHNHFIIFFGRFSDWRGCYCRCCCDFLHCARVFSTMPNAWSHHMKLSRQKKMKGQQPCDVADRELEFSISRKQRMIPTR